MKLSLSKSSRLLQRIAFSCLIKYQTEITIIHAGTNGLTNEINMLHNAKKTVKTNKRLRNYCCQKDIDYIDNSKTTEN